MLPRRINVLLVEQTTKDPEPIWVELKRAGYFPVWERVETRKDYLGLINRVSEPIDLILVDDPLPEFSVHEALDLLRTNQKDVPLIILGTPHNGEAVDYLRMGASDYVIKDRMARLGVAVTRILSEKQLRKDLSAANSQLLHTYDNILHAWAHALELRDFETLEHTKRVTALSVKLARFMGLNGDILTHMGRGALLHDIGKLGISDKILLKPGPLTADERATMQQHPLFAYLMLSPIEFLKPALEIPLCHHEKWDGSGYPYGLAGEKIPLVARIFAIVDVWDALNSSRPYRVDPWPKKKILAHLQEQSGKHFDPDVVQAFMMLMNSNGHY
jgi:HD-GYP domain-containing protein (c-di-GMP phosphodiesterase class II)